MTTNQPESVEARLSRLETLFVNMAERSFEHDNNIRLLTEKSVEHDNNIDVLVANIQQLTENVNNLTEQTTRNIERLSEQAAQDRQQAAIDRQAWQAEIQRIWEYLLRQGGNGRNGGNG